MRFCVFKSVQSKTKIGLWPNWCNVTLIGWGERWLKLILTGYSNSTNCLTTEAWVSKWLVGESWEPQQGQSRENFEKWRKLEKKLMKTSSSLWAVSSCGTSTLCLGLCHFVGPTKPFQFFQPCQQLGAALEPQRDITFKLFIFYNPLNNFNFFQFFPTLPARCGTWTSVTLLSKFALSSTPPLPPTCPSLEECSHQLIRSWLSWNIFQTPTPWLPWFFLGSPLLPYPSIGMYCALQWLNRKR